MRIGKDPVTEQTLHVFGSIELIVLIAVVVLLGYFLGKIF